MKVLHVNTNDKGGAATAIIRIHLGLLRRGVDSKILFLNKRKDIKETYQFSSKKSILKRLVTKLKTVLTTSAKDIREKYPNVEWFSNPTSLYDITEHPLYKEADIIQFNWISGFVDESSFFRKNTKPVVWRMPDLYACGGGYHYEKGFPFTKLKHVLKRNERIRQKALSGANLTFVPISQWSLQKAEASRLISGFPKKVIHNGLDFSIWKIYDKKSERQSFNIPLDEKVILLGAAMTQVERKGFELAISALQKINYPNLKVVIFGNYKGPLPNFFLNVGHIDSETSLARLYATADYFLMPSIEEAFGQVTIEALSCGIPVISFPTGGSNDIIEPLKNGILASNFTEEALTKALEEGLKKSFDKTAIRKDVMQRFNNESKVEDYYHLYEKLLQ